MARLCHSRCCVDGPRPPRARRRSRRAEPWRAYRRARRALACGLGRDWPPTPTFVAPRRTVRSLSPSVSTLRRSLGGAAVTRGFGAEHDVDACRPSMRGLLSATAMSCTASTIFWSIFQPSSVWAISRPLEADRDLHLVPLLQEPAHVLDLEVEVVPSVLGRNLTSLTSDRPSASCASLSRLRLLYLNLPKSMIRQTGGLAFGATSTRSRPAPRRCCSASLVGTMPSCAPSAPTTRTSRTRMRSLMRMSCGQMAWLPS